MPTGKLVKMGNPILFVIYIYIYIYIYMYIYIYIYIHYSKELKEHMLRTAYLEYYKCYNLIMLYASRELCKLRNKSWFNYQCGEDNACRCRCASTPPYMDWIYWLTETLNNLELSNY